LRLAIYLKLPEGGADVTPPQARFNGGAPSPSGGLAGQAIAIDGLSATSQTFWCASTRAAWPAGSRLAYTKSH